MNIGTFVDSGNQFNILTPTFLKTHSFITSITGGGKTGFILNIIQECRTKEFREKFGLVPTVILDEEGEFLKVPEFYEDFLLLDNDWSKDFFNVENAFELGKKIRQLGISVVVRMKQIGTKRERQEFAGKFTDGMMSVTREYWKPCIFIVDETDVYIPRRYNVPSKEPMIDACKRGRKTNLSIIMATQYASDVDIEARSNCVNRISGKTVELTHRKTMAEMLGDMSIKEKLWNLKVGQFYVRGDALTPELSLIQTKRPEIDTPEAGIEFKSNQKGKEIGDVVKIAMRHETIEPLVVAQQRKINELELQLEAMKDKILTTELKNEIWEEGLQYGIKKEHNKSIFTKLASELQRLENSK